MRMNVIKRLKKCLSLFKNLQENLKVSTTFNKVSKRKFSIYIITLLNLSVNLLFNRERDTREYLFKLYTIC